MIGTGMTGTAGAGMIATTAAIGMDMVIGTAAVAEVRHR